MAPSPSFGNSDTGSQSASPFASGLPTASKSLPEASKTTPPSFSMPPPPLPQPKTLPGAAGISTNITPPIASQDKPTGLGLGGFKSTSQLGSSPFGSQDFAKPVAGSPNTTAGFIKPPGVLGPQSDTNTALGGGLSPAISPLTTEKPAFPTVKPTTSPSEPLPTSDAFDSIPKPAQPDGKSVLFQGSAGPPPPAVPTQPKPEAPPRDLMGDFTKWFVMGDGGILEQFQVFMIDDLIRKTFDTFTKEAEEERLREEEERINQEVQKFRTYNLSLKYFYRWKQNARDKRLSKLRRSGRDQLRAFYASQHAADRTARKEAAKQAAKKRAQLANVNRPEEFMEMLKHKDVSRRHAREALLSSGVLSGMDNEREVVESIVRQEFRSRTNSVSTSYQSRESSPNSSRKLGAKTKALRELYLGKPGRFRRSLPSISSRESEPPENGRSTSNASARWRLKAMGIVQLPDGTAVPETMAQDMITRPSNYSSSAFGSTLGGNSIRRASVSGGSHNFGTSPLRRMGIPTVDDGSATNKRKRPSEEDVNEVDKNDSTERNKHKRIMSEAEKLTSELKAIRQELEEGREWFRSQNDRLRSESRAESPWFEDSI